MKRLTIGRNPNNDIVLDNNMVSRNHALLNVYSASKYEIVNMGTNGTKVNGVPIANGQPFPIKRGDAVIFAGQCQLDWNKVPKPRNIGRLIIIICGAITILSLLTWLTIFLVSHDWSSSECSDNANSISDVKVTHNDSTDIVSATEIIDTDTIAVKAVNLPHRKFVFPEQKKKSTDKPKTNKSESSAPGSNETTTPVVDKSATKSDDKTANETDATQDWHR